MQGLDWNALPLVVELVGAADVEQLVEGLIHIRDYQTKQSQANGR